MKKLFLPVFLLTATAALHADECCVEPTVKAEVCCEATKGVETCCPATEECCEQVCCETKKVSCDTVCCDEVVAACEETKNAQRELTAEEQQVVQALVTDLHGVVVNHPEAQALLTELNYNALLVAVDGSGAFVTRLVNQ